MKRRRLKRVILLTVLSAAVAVGFASVYYFKSRPYHFQAVADGIIYRSGTLKPEHLDAVLTDYGIRTVVNLRPVDPQNPPGWYVEEAAVCRRRGVSLIDIPMVPETPPTEEQVGKWLALLDDPGRLPILVHCKHGVIRTGMMVAVYEIEYERNENAGVLDHLPMFGHDLWSDSRKPMRDFILNYVPRKNYLYRLKSTPR